jgi:beta-glucosidase
VQGFFIMRFPDDFLWGAAVSAYQTEGGNFNCDWYDWEKKSGLTAAGRASGQRELFKQDIALAADLNIRAYRFSLEWSRVSPEPGVFDQAAISYYRDFCQELVSRRIKPIVTLHHFTNPLWFVQKGGWQDLGATEHFLSYSRRMVEELKGLVDTWVIFNEPMVYLYNGYIAGTWPPGRHSMPAARVVINNITQTHEKLYGLIHGIYSDRPVQVGIAQSLRMFCPCPVGGAVFNKLAANMRDYLFNQALLDYLVGKRSLDFIGANYYCREFDVWRGGLGRECGHDHGDRKNALGWNIYPEGFYRVLAKLKKYDLPVLVTENGTAETDQRLYRDYLIAHLNAVARAIQDGVKVQGYFWWSLLDNFEWDKGFDPRFGLYEVDYVTLARKKRPFADTYAKICASNEIPDEK